MGCASAVIHWAAALGPKPSWGKVGGWGVGTHIRSLAFFPATSGLKSPLQRQCQSCMFLLLLFQGGPVEILPFLYLGSAYHASKCEFLANLHITALLNVSRKSSESFQDQYCYKWIPVEDSHTADISSHFQEAIDFIGRCPGSSAFQVLSFPKGAKGFSKSAAYPQQCPSPHSRAASQRLRGGGGGKGTKIQGVLVA